ncbi:MAG: substrate-binding domain-containing protein, partial [Pseudomonadota bacterium]
VRTALALVARGEAPLGLVYATDALAEPRVAVVAEIPAESHPAIRYPAALLTGRGRAFFEFLTGAEAAALLRDAGFPPVPPA